MSLLDSLSPLKVVDRGYALITKGDGKDEQKFGQVVKFAKDVKKGDLLNVRLSQGSLQVSVDVVKN